MGLAGLAGLLAPARGLGDFSAIVHTQYTPEGENKQAEGAEVNDGILTPPRLQRPERHSSNDKNVKYVQ